jgi:hypothetical protein
MHESVRKIKNDLLLKIGIHEGPCLAVTLNDRLDYFGQTVNIAARVQNLADSQTILATKSVVEHPQVSKLLEGSELAPTALVRPFCGIAVGPDIEVIFEVASPIIGDIDENAMRDGFRNVPFRRTALG